MLYGGKVLDRRKIEIMIAGIGWCPCDISDIVEGDQFRVFEETGDPVKWGNNNTIFMATKDAYKRSDGVWFIYI